MTPTVSGFEGMFGFTCPPFSFLFLFLLLLPYGASARPCWGRLGRQPGCTEGPAEFDTCVAELQHLSPAPRFPGESQTGKSESPPPTSILPAFTLLIVFPFFLCAPCLPTYPEALRSPPFPPPAHFSTLNKSPFKIMSDAMTASPKTV